MFGIFFELFKVEQKREERFLINVSFVLFKTLLLKTSLHILPPFLCFSHEQTGTNVIKLFRVTIYKCSNGLLLQAQVCPWPNHSGDTLLSNRTTRIGHQCRKTTVLSCCRCLINTGDEKMNNFKI